MLTRVIIFFTACFIIAASDANEKISSQLESDLSKNKTVELYVLFNNTHKVQLDLKDNRLPRLKKSIIQLKSNAKVSQESIKPLISPLTKDYKFYWVNNSMWARLDSQQARKIIQSKHVLKAYSNSRYKLDIIKNRIPIKARKSTAWNLNMINVPQVWDLGYKGQNVIIAGQDTGYQWNHPALINQYLGWDGTTVNHNYAWHDAITNPHTSCLDLNNNPASCDDNGHGTHTMGTMIGDDGLGNQIGIAPEAKWMGCRNMNQGSGTPASYTECFQFFMEPTDINGQNPDYSKAPHIINNSWGCPPSEGCLQPNVLESVVNNVVNAGILVVAAAGNSGPACNSINSPLAIYDKTLTVGSTTSSDTISGFSARGAITVDGSIRLKPDVSAPGSSIRSAQLNGAYSNSSGTSMASPHVAGVAALLISANPTLAGNPELLKRILLSSSVAKSSTQTCNGIDGSQSPNNTFGWGRLDALAAIKQAKDFLYLDSFEGN